MQSYSFKVTRFMRLFDCPTCVLSVLTHTVDLTQAGWLFFMAATVNLSSHWRRRKVPFQFWKVKEWGLDPGKQKQSALAANRDDSTQRADLPTSTKPQFSLARLIWHSSAPLVSSTKHWLIMRTSANKEERERGREEREGEQWWSVFVGFLHHVMTRTVVSSQTRNQNEAWLEGRPQATEC